MKIKFLRSIIAFHSEPDNNGNTYWFIRFIDHLTGKMVEGQISGGESNAIAVMHEMGFDFDNTLFYVIKKPIRQFDREVEDMPYAGSIPRAIAEFINYKLAN